MKIIQLPEGTELIGILRETTPGRLVLSCRDYNAIILSNPDLQKKVAKLIGQKVGILRIDGKLHVRKIRAANSISKNFFRNAGNVACSQHFSDSQKDAIEDDCNESKAEIRSSF